MKDNKELKKIAKKAMTIPRGRLIKLSLTAIFTGGINLLSFLMTQIAIFIISAGLHSDAWGDSAKTMFYIYIAVTVYLLLSVVVGSFVELGYDRVMLHCLRGEPVPRGVMFSFRRKWTESLMLRLCMSLKATLWSLMFFVPGIVAVFNYSMAPYLLAQNPGMGAQQAIKVSKMLMKGYRKKLLMLILSYLDEIIISIITLGLPFVYVIPRIKMAVAAFYRERVALHDEEVRAMREKQYS